MNNKVFFSWSGSLSCAVAEEFKVFIEGVLQGVDIFFSKDSIQSGQQWLSKIKENLDICSHGVIFLTKTNLDAPWMNFEAGAIQSNNPNQISTVLIEDVANELRSHPLGIFNWVNLSRDGLLDAVLSIYESLEISLSKEHVLENFELRYDKFEGKLKAIIENFDQSDEFVATVESVFNMIKDVKTMLQLNEYNQGQLEDQILSLKNKDDNKEYTGGLTSLLNRSYNIFDKKVTLGVYVTCDKCGSEYRIYDGTGNGCNICGSKRFTKKRINNLYY